MTTSSPSGGTPTDLMLTPNWNDQNVGTWNVGPALGLGAQHVVRRDLGLLDRVAPVLERQELEPEQRVRRAGDVARGEDVVGDDAVHVEHAAPGIAGDAARARPEARVAQPFGVALGAERDHGHVDLQRGAVVEEGAAHVSCGVAFQRGHADPAPQVDSLLTLHVGGDGADRGAQRSRQRRRRAFGDRHRQAEAPADRGDLGAGEPRSDQQDAAGSGGQRVAQPHGVVSSPERDHAIQRGFRRVGPRARPGSGGDQQPVVAEFPAVGHEHPLARQVQPGRGRTQPPLGIETGVLRQRGRPGVRPS